MLDFLQSQFFISVSCVLLRCIIQAFFCEHNKKNENQRVLTILHFCDM